MKPKGRSPSCRRHVVRCVLRGRQASRQLFTSIIHSHRVALSLCSLPCLARASHAGGDSRVRGARRCRRRRGTTATYSFCCLARISARPGTIASPGHPGQLLLPAMSRPYVKQGWPTPIFETMMPGHLDFSLRASLPHEPITGAEEPCPHDDDSTALS